MRKGWVVGAVLGGLSRFVLAYCNLTHGDWGWFFLVGLLCIPSLALGALCGGVAGNSRTVLAGALWGAVLSGLTFLVFVIPVAWIAGAFDAHGKVEQFSTPLLLQRSLLGAVVGAIAVRAGQGTSARSISARLEREGVVL